MSAQAMLSWLGAVAVAVAVGVAALWAGRRFFPGALLTAVLALLLYHRKDLLVVAKTFRRDLRSFRLLRVTYKFLSERERKNETVLDLFGARVQRHPRKALFYFEERAWTYADVDALSNRIGNVFREAGYGKGDVVALLMGNCPEYVCVWVGLAKIGAVTALVNTNLRHRSLVHCIRAAEAKALVYSEEFESVVREVSGEIGGLEKYRWGEPGGGSPSADLRLLAGEAAEGPPAAPPVAGYRDKVLYVYTSGTTGLPKAAVIPHHRLLMMSMAVSCIMGVGESDVVYNPLPLFHTAGGLLGIAGALSHGFSSVIKRKFSASAFWPDCVKYNCTVAQYIGEMCRYVMMVPPRPEDVRHRVRFVFGNGMRKSLWTDFKERFRLERICEIYGSTEGNTNLVNLDATVGAVGFLPKIVPRSLVPMALIKVDDFGEPVRNSRGLCIRCAANEPGMFIGMIVNSDATREYSGYVGNKNESEKKIVRDVFRKGDRAFLSGDILVMDELGYLYFKDRTGDTFKWKGENVSTAEVEGILSAAVGLRDVLAYGVEVGNLEGRAGMATVVDPEAEVDLRALAAHIDENLPPYARPLFLRFTDRVDLTGTFKLKKLNFQREGFDPDKTADRLYFKRGGGGGGGGGYVPLTKQLYEEIVSGQIRV